MDAITITDLELWTHLGVPDLERKTEQRVLVTIELTVSLKEAAKEDDVDQSINYDDLSKDIKALSKTPRKTLERLAEDIASLAIEKYRPDKVTVEAKKFVLPDAKATSVTVVRP